MPKRALDLEVLRNGRHWDAFHINGDPADVGAMRDALVGWLAGNKWSPGRWREFDLAVREAGGARVMAKVRAV